MKSRKIEGFAANKLEMIFMKSEFFKISKTSGKLAGDFSGSSKAEDMVNLGELWATVVGILHGYHRQFLDPASPGGPQTMVVAFGPLGGPVDVDHDGGSPAQEQGAESQPTCARSQIRLGPLR
jgi:hypothetical protein